MAANNSNTIRVSVIIHDNGTLELTSRGAKKAKKEFDSLGVSAEKANAAISKFQRTKAADSALNKSKSPFQENVEYRNARGVAGTGGGGSRDFAKQAQGLGGLVHLYATFAANIFAVSAAFMALNNAMQFEQMIAGAQALEKQTGIAFTGISKQMVAVTNGALSLKEAMTFSALGGSAGIPAKKLLELTKYAKGASVALGRDMSDSINRVIRGVTKLEPELLDELGVTVKATEAYRNYARQLGISETALTSYQKTMAYTTAVSEELKRKFGDISDEVEASPFEKFVGELKNAGTDLLSMVNKVITPILTLFADNVELIYIGILAVVKNLTMKAIPEIARLFSVDPAAVKKQQELLQDLHAQSQEYFRVEKAAALSHTNELIKLKENEINNLKKLKEPLLQQTKDFVKQTYSKQTPTAQKILSTNSLDQLKNDGEISRSISAKRNSIVKAITAEEAKGTLQNEKQLAILRAQRDEANRILVGLKAESVQDAELVGLQKQLLNLQNERNIAQNIGLKKTQLQTDLVKNELILAKLRRQEEMEAAKYKFGKGSSKYKETDVYTKDMVRKATAGSLLYNQDPNKYGQMKQKMDFVGPLLPKEEAERMKGFEGLLSPMNKKLLGFKMGLLGVTDSFKLLTVAVSEFMLIINTWIAALFIAYEAISFLLKVTGALNPSNDKLSDSYTAVSDALQAANNSQEKYVELSNEAAYSIDSLIRKNEMVGVTYDQVTESLLNQSEAYKEWIRNNTALSNFWDGILGGSRAADTLKENAIKGVDALIQKAPKGKDKEELKSIKTELIETDSASKVLDLTKKIAETSSKISDNAKNTAASFKDTKESAAKANAAMTEFNSKLDIKNENLRTTVTFLNNMSEELAKLTPEEQMMKLATLADKSEILKYLPESLQKTIALSYSVLEVQALIAANQEQMALSQKQVLEMKNKKSLLDKLDELFDEALEAIGYGLAKMGWALIDGFVAVPKKFGELFLDVFKTMVVDGKWLEGMKKIGISIIKAIFPFETVAKILDGLSKGASTARDERSGKEPGALSVSDLKKKAEIAKLEARIAELTANNKRLQKFYEDLRKGLSLDTASKGLKEGASNTASLDNKTNTKPKFYLEKEEMRTEIESLQMSNKVLDQRAAIEKRTLGLVNETTIKEKEVNDLAIAKLQYDLGALDIAEKYTQEVAQGLMSEKKAEELRNKALVNLQKTKEYEEKAANDKAKQELLERKSAENQFKVYDVSMRSLDLTQARINQAKALGSISEEDLITLNSSIELDKLSAKYQQDKIILEEASLGNKNLALEKLNAEYDAAVQKLTTEEYTNLVLERRNKITSTYQLLLEQNSMNIEEAAQSFSSQLKAVNLIAQKGTLLKDQAEFQLSIATSEQERLKIKLDYQKELITLYNEELELRKKAFLMLDSTTQAQTLYDEAVRQYRDFYSKIKDVVTGTFDSIYAGMDAAIDELADKMMRSENLSIKELITTFRNTAAESFRDLAADYMKLQARNTVKGIIGKVTGADLSTPEEKAAKEAAKLQKSMSLTQDNMLINLQAINQNLIKIYEDGIVVKTKEEAGNRVGQGTQAKEKTGTPETEIKAQASKVLEGIWENARKGLSGIFGEGGFFSGLLGKVGKWLSDTFFSIMGGSVPGGEGMGSAIMGAVDWIKTTFFANGGVMSQYGPLALHAYAKGGVADRPQVALFGEGRKNEAYVPLPDNRSIPVTLNGSGASQSNMVVNVTVNDNATINTESSDEGTPQDRAKNQREFANRISSMIREEMVQQKRPGGLLYYGR